MTYAFAAAGTGGHVYPALTVADELVARGVDRSEIVFFGGDRMEASAVPAAGYRFVGVEIRGLKRSLDLGNLRLPRVVWLATRDIAAAMRDLGTKVATAFGGYVSVPAAWAARRTGAAVFLHEQNAVPGLANKMIARWTTSSFVAFPAAAPQLRRSRVVGNPVRRALRDFDRDLLRAAARRRYSLPEDIPVLGVLGGSLGARVLNDATRRIAIGADPRQMAIVHLTGEAHHAAVEAQARDSDVIWHPVAFEREMEYFYAAADLVLGRAGALTISELAMTGTPAVVVPLEAVAQQGNAEYLAAAGAVLVVPEAEIDWVPAEIGRLLAARDRLDHMASAARAAAQPDAAAIMAGVLMENAR